jgi:hypothetical protein
MEIVDIAPRLSIIQGVKEKGRTLGPTPSVQSANWRSDRGGLTLRVSNLIEAYESTTGVKVRHKSAPIDRRSRSARILNTADRRESGIAGNGLIP